MCVLSLLCLVFDVWLSGRGTYRFLKEQNKHSHRHKHTYIECLYIYIYLDVYRPMLCTYNVQKTVRLTNEYILLKITKSKRDYI